MDEDEEDMHVLKDQSSCVLYRDYEKMREKEEGGEGGVNLWKWEKNEQNITFKVKCLEAKKYKQRK